MLAMGVSQAATIVVPAGGDLQMANNAAQPGDMLLPEDGATFICNCVFDKSLTVQGRARIVSPNADPAVFIPPKTRDVTLRGLEITASGSMIYDIVRIGEWQTSVLADVPTNIVIDQCDIHGQTWQEVQRGIAANGANVSILNSTVREIHGRGYDTQAVAIWNGPGPLKILDSALEASGENFMAGGADARIPNLVPSDIEIRRSRIFKPLAWRGVWTAKNLLELKSARRVTIDGNIMENSWVDGQIGWGVLFTVRNQDGTNPWAVIEDVTFTNNSLLNVAGGFQLLGSDYNHPSLQSSRLKISNNIIRLNPALGGNGRLIMIQGYNDVQFLNNDANPAHTFLLLTGTNADGSLMLSERLVYQNNLVSYGEYGAFADVDRPLTMYAPDVNVSGNWIYGPGIPESRKIVGNTYLLAKPNPVPAGVGVDMEALLAAQGGTNPTPTPSVTPTPTPKPCKGNARRCRPGENVLGESL